MDNTIVEHSGIQIKIRSYDSNIGWNKINEIAAALDSVYKEKVLIDETIFEIQTLKRMTDVASLGKEENGRRFLFTINYIGIAKEIEE